MNQLGGPVDLADEASGDLADEASGDLADEASGDLADEASGDLADEASVRRARTSSRAGLLTGTVAIAVLSLGGAFLADRETERALDAVRGTRVELEAAAALAGAPPPEGQLTIVRETESARYPFLNKRSYVVDTASAARAGTVLRGSDPADLARAERHRLARRRGVLREPIGDGRWRVTVAAPRTAASAAPSLTAEVTADPPPVPRPAPWRSALLAFAAGFAILLVAAPRVSPAAAAVAGVAVAGAGTLAFAAVHLGEAAALAGAYLGAVVAHAPPVALPGAGVLASLAGLAVVDVLGLLVVLSPRGRALRARLARDRFAYAAIAPALLGLGVLVGIPFAFGIALSFFEHEHGRFTFVGLANFAHILRPPAGALFAPGTLLYALTVNVIWTVSNVFFHVAIGLVLALLLQRQAARVSRFYRIILIVPWAVPAYLTALIWKSMFDPDVGAVNRLLGLEGMSWMHSTTTAFLANLITNVWLGFPFMMVVCLGALTSIPRELYEAADVDGASGWQQLVRITLPLLEPALLPAVILGSIWTFNRFEVIYLVSEGRPDGATDILVTEAYRWAFERGMAQGGAYGYAAAYSVVIFVVLLIYGWMTSRVARAAEEALR